MTYLCKPSTCSKDHFVGKSGGFCSALMHMVQSIWQPCSSVRTGKRTNCRDKSAGRETGGTKTAKLSAVTWEQSKNGSFANLLLLRAQAARREDPRALRRTRSDQNAHEETVETKPRAQSRVPKWRRIKSTGFLHSSPGVESLLMAHLLRDCNSDLQL